MPGNRSPGTRRYGAAMADIYELAIALDLRDDLTDDEVAELRWHLGLGPRPETPAIVRTYNIAVEGGPVLGHHGEAWKVGGALTSVLTARRAGGWALALRQEVHPDQYDEVGELLTWLAARATDAHRRFDGAVRLGWTRHYECDQPDPLDVRDGKPVWP